MLLPCILPFVVFLFDRFQGAFGENHISIQLFPGMPFESMSDGYPDPPKCTAYDDCGLLDWNQMSYVQFLQPDNSQYPLKCTMRADNVKHKVGHFSVSYFEINEKYEANYIGYLFTKSESLKYHDVPFHLSIACSNGAHRCCHLRQKFPTLKGYWRGHNTDQPVVIEPKVEVPSNTRKGNPSGTNPTQKPPPTPAKPGHVTVRVENIPAQPEIINVNFDATLEHPNTDCSVLWFTPTCLETDPTQSTCVEPCPEPSPVIPSSPHSGAQNSITEPNVSNQDNVDSTNAASRLGFQLSMKTAQHMKPLSVLHRIFFACPPCHIFLAALVFPYLFLLPFIGY